MGITMSCKNICEIEDEARGVVARLVDLLRKDGHKNDAAICYAADLFQITRRSAWALKYRQPLRVTRALRDRIVTRWWEHMEARAAQLRQEADEIDRQARAAREAEASQYGLPLGNSDNGVESLQGRVVSVSLAALDKAEIAIGDEMAGPV